jgi:tRNA dimethylallyltransferase
LVDHGRTKIAAIVGPTAAGKTAAALEVAEALRAEIVSVDSMQMYSGMDIGTDKATPEMRKRVPHHLLDAKDPSEDLSVQEFQERARRAIKAVATRGRLPLLVGGSGLYFRAVVDDLRFPPRRDDVRRALEQEASEVGPEALYERLRSLDPPAAARMEPTNVRRIVRALEVIEITGRRFSAGHDLGSYESIYELAVAGVTRPRAELFTRIDRRVDAMLQAGLMEEARGVAERGMGRTARQALGYRQVLDAGPEATAADVKPAVVAATKRFARRQEAWFRADPRVQWFDASRPGLIQALRGFFVQELSLGTVSS